MPQYDTVPNVGRPEWLKLRGTGLGSSDAAAVLGVSHWKSPFRLWAEKRNQLDGTADEKEYVSWGRRLEQPLREAFADETKRLVLPGLDGAKDMLARSTTHPFMLATIDGTTRVNDGLPAFSRLALDPRPEIAPDAPGVLELKTAAFFKSDEWAEEPPLEYQVQVQHQLAVLGWEWGAIAVLLGGQKFLWIDVPRNQRFIDLLVEREAEFWERIQRDDPPQPDGSDETAKLLMALYPRPVVEVKALPAELIDTDVRLVVVKQQLKELEDEKGRLENEIRLAIGDAMFGQLPSGVVYSWKEQHRQGYTVQPTTFRALRRTKGGAV